MADKKYGIKALATGRSDLLRIDPRHLVVNDGWNCREVDFDPNDPEDRALADSIADVGVKQPLTAIWNGTAACITDGHRRLAATMWAIQNLGAEIQTVPVQTEDRYASDADMVLSQIVRNNGKPLTPMETARVYKRLIGFGWTERDIAQKVGRSEKWVRNLLLLSAAPSAVTEKVSSGQVSASTAITAIKQAKGDGAAAAEKLGEAVELASSRGRERATNKDVSRVATPIKRVKAVLSDLQTSKRITRSDDDAQRVTLDLSVDEFQSLMKAVGLKDNAK